MFSSVARTLGFLYQVVRELLRRAQRGIAGKYRYVRDKKYNPKIYFHTSYVYVSS
jgi:hypothetical protein